MDRGYVDFRRLHQIDQASAYFVIRAKDNMAYSRHESYAIEEEVRSDQRISLSNYYAKKIIAISFGELESLILNKNASLYY